MYRFFLSIKINEENAKNRVEQCDLDEGGNGDQENMEKHNKAMGKYYLDQSNNLWNEPVG